MGSLSNWSNNGNEGLSQKVFGKVKPDAPIKNKIDNAQKKLELQISKLGNISEKLQKKNDQIFEKIVRAQRTNNHAYAKAYAAAAWRPLPQDVPLFGEEKPDKFQ